MAWLRVWISSWLLGLVVIHPGMSQQPPGSDPLCRALAVVNSSLALRERVHYMKHNMPINYTIPVHYEEIFKLKNVSRLRRNVEGLEDVDLQETWLRVNQGILGRIKDVLPPRHPSRNYTENLDTLFRNLGQIFPEGREPPERIERIWDVLGTKLAGRATTTATPKSLLDNCYHTMHCIFTSCFPSHADYCQRSHWRGEKKAALKKALDVPQN
ncbi:interleukin-34 [Engraulis encrasicolus]|uniref:interleukin-34 n=1 Tax=Engraulis encrasicolus TaxID=184585 RepID=UPI002FD0EBF8